MFLNFREWLLKEATGLSPEQLQMFGLKPGDTIDPNAVNIKYKELAKKFHPDRAGDDIQMRSLNDAIAKLRELIRTGQRIPMAGQGQFRGQHYQTWQQPQRNIPEEFRKDIKDILDRAIKSVQKAKQSGQPSYLTDAFGMVQHLIDPNTGKLNKPVPGYTINPLLKSSLEQWANYFNNKFYDYLEPILTHATQLV